MGGGGIRCPTYLIPYQSSVSNSFWLRNHVVLPAFSGKPYPHHILPLDSPAAIRFYLISWVNKSTWLPVQAPLLRHNVLRRTSRDGYAPGALGMTHFQSAARSWSTDCAWNAFWAVQRRLGLDESAEPTSLDLGSGTPQTVEQLFADSQLLLTVTFLTWTGISQLG